MNVKTGLNIIDRWRLLLSIILKRLRLKLMAKGYLLNRIKLKFQEDEIREDLSAVVYKPDNKYLWLASDENNAIERLTKIDRATFGEHKSFKLKDLIAGFNDEDGEVDIEGLDYDSGYLWLAGSHSTKREKPKGDKINKEELEKIERERNRYLIARIPVENGELVKSTGELNTAILKKTEKTNILLEALETDNDDPNFFKNLLSIDLSGKDNGLDIEGLIVRENKILLGLRGPVLRGAAIVLEIEIEELESGIIGLKQIGTDGKHYKKYFLDLDGLGIREFCLDGEDLLVLAGPTMALDGALRLFRLKNTFDLEEDDFIEREDSNLEVLFDIPFGKGVDRAEGITMYPGLTDNKSILVVYDSPDSSRIVDRHTVLADVFQLE